MKKLDISADLTCTVDNGTLKVSDVNADEVKLNFSDKHTFFKFLNAMGINLFTFGKARNYVKLLDYVDKDVTVQIANKMVAQKPAQSSLRIKYLNLIERLLKSYK